MSEGFGGAPLIKPRRQGTTLSVDPPREFPPNPQIPEIPQYCFFGVDSPATISPLQYREFDHKIVTLTNYY